MVYICIDKKTYFFKTFNKNKDTDMAKQEIKKGKVSELIEDDMNANLGSAEGMKLLKKSVERFGAGRSILIDKNNRVIAGNKTKRTAEESGIEEVLVVKTDGTELVAVMREDIDLNTAEGRSMAIADNRASEKNLVWNVENLEKMEEDFSVDLSQHWNEAELLSLLESLHETERKKGGGFSGGGSELNGIRQIVLYYDEDEHHEVITDLEAIGAKLGIEEDNSEVVLALMNFYKEQITKEHEN